MKISENEFVECANAGPYRIPVYVSLDNAVDITVDANRFLSSTATQYLVYIGAVRSAANYRIDNNDATNFTPTTQDVYIGGPTLAGLPSGVTPAAVRGSWAIRRVGIDLPRMGAGETSEVSARIRGSEYARARAVVTPFPMAAHDDYELSNARFPDHNTLTITVRNRTADAVDARSLTVDLRVVYP